MYFYTQTFDVGEAEWEKLDHIVARIISFREAFDNSNVVPHLGLREGAG